LQPTTDHPTNSMSKILLSYHFALSLGLRLQTELDQHHPQVAMNHTKASLMFSIGTTTI
jgi:hypothetical protein